MIAKTRLRRFTDEIWSWYITHKRDLPWRDLWHESQDTRAYKVLVSEVMLQQTHVPRVMILFPQFLKTFPTLEVLADASNKDVVMAWRGLGYNRRALMLRDAARHICGECSKCENLLPLGGRARERGSRNIHPPPLSNSLPTGERKYSFPKTMDELLSIPGIGPYTAAAIRNFAFNLPTPCIDTNIRRVLHRRFFGPQNPDGTWKKSDRELLSLAEEVLYVATTHYPLLTTHYPATDWHHALMDYGSLKEKAVKFPRKIHKEPGRTIGARYVPNRIFRGKIIEELRKTTMGLDWQKIGERVCSDWEPDLHREWLTKIMDCLKKDALIAEQKGKYVLKE